MLTTLRVLLAALGAASVLICLSIITFGPSSTAFTFERGFDQLTGWRGPFSAEWPPTMDSELRFYAPLFGAYGVLLLIAARDYPKRRNLTPLLAGVFFVGGVGRVASLAAVGPPHPFFVLLMSIELILPLLLIGLWAALEHRAHS